MSIYNMEGKVAIVTGGAMGIGRSAALRFAKEGAKVVVADIAVNDGEKTVNEIVDNGGDAIFVEVDVRSNDQVKTMIDKTIAKYNRLDYAFNNVGVNGEAAFTADTTVENFDFVVGVNLKGMWLCMRNEIPAMLKSGGGAIVNVSSVAGVVAGPGLPLYSASKGGIIMLTKTAAVEYAGGNNVIRVNAICPSLTRTPMGQRVYDAQPDLEQERLDNHPLGRMAEPDEIAAAAVWLCSDMASFVTGHIMMLDGGFTVQ